MKKFISVLLAILMVVAVMPFAIFAADEAEEASPVHPCHPDSFIDVDMAAAGVKVTAKTAADVHAGVMPEYLTDGKADTATRLPTGDKATFQYKFAEFKDFAQVKVVVNGKGTINGGATAGDKVTVATNFDFKVQVVIKNDIQQVIYKSEEVSTLDETTLVFDVFTEGMYIEIIVDAAAKTTGGPRLWEVDANTLVPEEDYEHDLEEIVVKASTTKTAGKAYVACKNCDYKEDEYDLPLLTGADLTGGILTLDDVTLEEYIKEVDDEGNVLKDDDGNDILIDKPFAANPEALFDGDTNSGGLWGGSGSYWTAAPGGKLTIKFNEPKEIAFIKFHLTFNSWPGVSFQFYNGETLVAKKNGNWKNDGSYDDRWTNTWHGDWIDFSTEDYCDLQGKVIDKIVIEIFHHGTHNYRKISEVQIGTHIHQYNEADIIANGTHGTGKDICKWTHKAKCVECEAVANNAVAYIHDIETTVHREATCGNGINTDTCKAEGCEYVNENYTVPGTGEHDFSTHVVQAKRATCGADGSAYFICSECKEREVVPNVTVSGDGEGYEEAMMAIVANLTGKKLAQAIVVEGVTIAKKDAVLTEEQVMVALKMGVTEFYLACKDAQKDDLAVTIKYAISVSGEYADGDVTGTIKALVGEATNGLHTMGVKNIVPSTYTIHGEDYAYCTTCGVEFKDIRSEAALKKIGSGVHVRFNGFTLRTADYEGIRATFSLNKEVLNQIFGSAYSVRIWVVATNASGETSELQVYGAGAKNAISNDGRFSVVVKDLANSQENIKFQLKISVKDANGEQIEYRDVATTSLAKVKNA